MMGERGRGRGYGRLLEASVRRGRRSQLAGLGEGRDAVGFGLGGGRRDRGGILVQEPDLVGADPAGALDGVGDLEPFILLIENGDFHAVAQIEIAFGFRERAVADHGFV